MNICSKEVCTYNQSLKNLQASGKHCFLQAASSFALFSGKIMWEHWSTSSCHLFACCESISWIKLVHFHDFFLIIQFISIMAEFRSLRLARVLMSSGSAGEAAQQLRSTCCAVMRTGIHIPAHMCSSECPQKPCNWFQ